MALPNNAFPSLYPPVPFPPNPTLYSMRPPFLCLILSLCSGQREMWAALVVLYDALVGPLELGAKTQFWTLLQAGRPFLLCLSTL